MAVHTWVWVWVWVWVRAISRVRVTVRAVGVGEQRTDGVARRRGLMQEGRRVWHAGEPHRRKVALAAVGEAFD